MTDVVALDLFVGAGGMSYGLQRSGIRVDCGVDINDQCRFPFEANVGGEFLHRDVGAILEDWHDSEVPPLDLTELEKYYPDNSVRLLVGCAPCQPFSDLTNSQSAANPGDWALIEALRRTVDRLDIDIVAMENVPGLAQSEVYIESFGPWFTENGYDVWAEVIDSSKYGVPQSRKRFVFLASKMGDIELLSPTNEDNPVTVRDVLEREQLGEIGPGEQDLETHALHRAAGLRATNRKRMRHTREGEDWHNLPDELQPASAKTSSYTSYGRMWWDEPAPTLTTNFYNWGSGRFGHPGYNEDSELSVDRAISLYEGALLQTFPPDYEFVSEGEDINLASMGRLIGNAVPVRLAEVIGESIQRHLAESSVSENICTSSQTGESMAINEPEGSLISTR